MNLSGVIISDPEILHGTPVPIESLFWHLEDSVTINSFLEDFSSVTKEQCNAVIEIAEKKFI